MDHPQLDGCVRAPHKVTQRQPELDVVVDCAAQQLARASEIDDIPVTEAHQDRGEDVTRKRDVERARWRKVRGCTGSFCTSHGSFRCHHRCLRAVIAEFRDSVGGKAQPRMLCQDVGQGRVRAPCAFKNLQELTYY